MRKKRTHRRSSSTALNGIAVSLASLKSNSKRLPKAVYFDRREWAAIEQLGSQYECNDDDVIRLAVRKYLGIG